MTDTTTLLKKLGSTDGETSTDVGMETPEYQSMTPPMSGASGGPTEEEELQDLFQSVFANDSKNIDGLGT